jgi:hypothetical protein
MDSQKIINSTNQRHSNWQIASDCSRFGQRKKKAREQIVPVLVSAKRKPANRCPRALFDLVALKLMG